MNITECISAIREIQYFISKLDENGLYEKLEPLGISEERRNILLEIIKEPKNNWLSVHDTLDVLLNNTYFQAMKTMNMIQQKTDKI
jgi:hypothetical protein